MKLTRRLGEASVRCVQCCFRLEMQLLSQNAPDLELTYLLSPQTPPRRSRCSVMSDIRQLFLINCQNVNHAVGQVALWPPKTKLGPQWIFGPEHACYELNESGSKFMRTCTKVY